MGTQLSIGPLEGRILLIRGRRVLLDRELASLYGVSTRALVQAVKRNHGRFPEDFMFQLSAEEAAALVSQSVIPSGRSLGGRPPYAFTQEGVAMLSSVLRSGRAIQVNIAVMRAFVRLRSVVALHKDLAVRLKDLELRFMGHEAEIQNIFEAIRRLMAPPKSRRLRIGFRPGSGG